MSKILFPIVALFLYVSHIAAQDRLSSALRKYNYVEAVSILDSMIARIAPDSLSAVANKTELIELALQKSKCQKKLQRPDNAAQTLASVLQYDRYNIELMAELADCHTANEDYDSAMMLYSILAVMQPDNVYFKLCKAKIQYHIKAYEDVVNECKSILAIDTIPDVLYMTGNCYKQLGQLDSAMTYYDKLLTLNPLSAKAISRKSDILFKENKFDEVLEMTDPYLKEVSDNMEILPLRGLALYLKKDYLKSLQTFEYQQELGDDSYTVHYYLGMNNYMLSRWSRAAKEFESAYRIDSTDVKLVCKLADSYSYLPGRDALSIAYFDKAITMMQPDSSLMKTIFDRKATLAFNANDFKKAIDYYKQSYDYGKTNISALLSIGYCYECLKDYKNALSYYEQYKKIGKPGSSGYKYVEESIAYVKAELFMLE